MSRSAYVLVPAMVALVTTIAVQKCGSGNNALRLKRPPPSGRNEWRAARSDNRAGKPFSRNYSKSTTFKPLSPRKKTNGAKRVILPNITLSAEVVNGIQTFVFFIGYARSTHTLVASLLDAHPHMIVSNEYNLLMNYGLHPSMERHEMFENMYRRSRLDVEQGKRYNPSAPPVPAELQMLARDSYSYYVPGQWQGKFRDYIQVIGDKKGGSTSSYLAQQHFHPILRSLVEKIGLRTRVVHVIRNPYDAITTATLRTMGGRFKFNESSQLVVDEKRLQNNIKTFFTAANTNSRAHRDDSFPAPILDIHSYDLNRQPRETLLKLCRFLEIECGEPYLKSCAGIVRQKPSRTRRFIVWPQHLKDQVWTMMQDIPFLAGYSFESK